MEGSILDMIAGFIPSGPPVTSGATGRLDTPSSSHLYTSTNTRMSRTPCDLVSGATAAATVARRVVHMVCFSKDRAFQLDQLLESAKRHLLLVIEGQEMPTAAGRIILRISVLYTTTATETTRADEEAIGSKEPLETTAVAVGTAATAGSPEGNSSQGSEQQHHKEDETNKNKDNSDSDSATCPNKEAFCTPKNRTMQQSYDLVRRRHPGVKFVREEPGKFCDQLLKLVGGEGGGGDGKGRREEDEGVERFVMFAVDDMFFYRDFGLLGALQLLSKGQDTSQY